MTPIYRTSDIKKRDKNRKQTHLKDLGALETFIEISERVNLYMFIYMQLLLDNV